MRTARRMRLQGAGNVRDLGGYPCGETITAVSYTHLDVYKRQALCSGISG